MTKGRKVMANARTTQVANPISIIRLLYVVPADAKHIWRFNACLFDLPPKLPSLLRRTNLSPFLSMISEMEYLSRGPPELCLPI